MLGKLSRCFNGLLCQELTIVMCDPDISVIDSDVFMTINVILNNNYQFPSN